jgi:hypothetical protein
MKLKKSEDHYGVYQMRWTNLVDKLEKAGVCVISCTREEANAAVAKVDQIVQSSTINKGGLVIVPNYLYMYQAYCVLIKKVYRFGGKEVDISESEKLLMPYIYDVDENPDFKDQDKKIFVIELSYKPLSQGSITLHNVFMEMGIEWFHRIITSSEPFKWSNFRKKDFSWQEVQLTRFEEGGEWCYPLEIK